MRRDEEEMRKDESAENIIQNFVRWKYKRKENGLERNENENDASGIQTRKDENFYSLWFFSLPSLQQEFFLK